MAIVRGERAELERMRAARRRLAQVRQRVRRLSWMARDPDSLHADVPLLSLPAFLRALARFQTIRLRQEEATLLLLRVQPCDAALRRAVAMHLIECTRNCDTLGCAGSDTFLLLLKTGEAGAHSVARRLQVELRQLAASMDRLVRLHPVLLTVDAHLHPRTLLGILDEMRMQGNTHPAARPRVSNARVAGVHRL